MNGEISIENEKTIHIKKAMLILLDKHCKKIVQLTIGSSSLPPDSVMQLLHRQIT